jgi:Na+-driven multidrug efflux pump
MAANRFLAITSVVSAAVNLVGNYVLGHALGVPGIALSTAIVYLCTFAMLFGFVAMRLRRAEQDAALLTHEPAPHAEP